MKKNGEFVAAIFAALCLNSCDKNDPDNPIAGGSGKILNNSPTQCNRYGWNGLYATH